MEEVADEANRRPVDRVHSFNSASRGSDSSHVIPITSATASPTSNHLDADYDINNVTSANWGEDGELNPQDAWLPLTESRKGNAFSASFHLQCSGIGVQALLLPVAFATLGWSWGTVCLSLAFTWQLYTIWLLVHLHESDSGIRYSRYLDLAMTAFGQKLGKVLALVPVMYLSAGTCVQLIIIGGGTILLFIRTVCRDGSTCDPKSLTGSECFLVFMCMAIAVAQFPNLNSMAWVSFIGTTTAVVYCTLVWGLSIGKGRINNVSYDPPAMESNMDRFGGIMNAIGIICLAFRGHNVILEIQGTLPTNPKFPTSKTMWRGVTISYALIAICLLPVAIAGFWTYGNKVPSSNGGLLIAISQFHAHDTSKVVLGLIYILVIVHCLSTFQIYGMVIFDKLESNYTSRKNMPCARWLRTALRVFFGGVTFFAAVTFPFLGSLAPILGGVTLPLTYAYPCWMWIAIKKPQPKGVMWCINMGLGCLGLCLSVILVVAASWNIAHNGLKANFFRP
ncbi:putative amino acid transporter, transmembrane domain-containing protein [Rosa chinensis]|uniref:Putative amino acid transporter, transmembrane domain-containing protein n=1 Tax=Rosa chinensis TaxID=74649 RepID=A0A2P6PT19_ROSCH|nr:lysine histidine transporter-like 8 [Rosa chinensis]PRQ25080.1 putative amino acid transporter, transmembrane domain-containing protein [Rosa chinensis]